MHAPRLAGVHQVRRPAGDPVPVERPRVLDQEEHRAEEAEVADPVGDERLLARRGVERILVPEADEQVRAEPHALPADEEERQVVREDQDEHREDEEVQVTEEARVPVVVRHVRRGVEVDEEADAGDDEHHHAAQLVDAELDVDGDRRPLVTARRVHPLPGVPHQLDVRASVLLGELGQADEGDHRGDEAHAHRGQGHHADGLLAEAAAPDAVHEGAEERHPEDDRDEHVVVRGKDGEHRGGSPSSSAGRLRRTARCGAGGTWRARWPDPPRPRRPRRR